MKIKNLVIEGLFIAMLVVALLSVGKDVLTFGTHMLIFVLVVIAIVLYQERKKRDRG